MRKVTTFTFVSLDGHFAGPGGDLSWHRHGEEENEYAAEGLGSGSTLLFGRVTYELMAGYWPTPMALANDPAVAKGMNAAEKIVFSRTLKTVEWSNTRLVTGDPGAEIRRLKQLHGQDMTLLGSGSILAQLADQGLVDEYQVMVDPVVLGAGKTLFQGIRHRLDLKLTSTRTFRNGNVLLCYAPAAMA